MLECGLVASGFSGSTSRRGTGISDPFSFPGIDGRVSFDAGDGIVMLLLLLFLCIWVEVYSTTRLLVYIHIDNIIECIHR